jgi:hypothetical protein
MYTKSKLIILLFVLLACSLAACGSQTKFVAPEIDPPTDLIPGYVPKGYELISGFQIKVSNFNARLAIIEEDGRIACGKPLIVPFFDLKSPAGNDLMGVYYQKKDHLLLITKSYFPEGSLDGWRESYDASHQDAWDGERDCDCGCDCWCNSCSGYPCVQLLFIPPIPFRNTEVQEVRTVGDTQIAVLQKPSGWVTIFVRGEYLIAVEGDLSLEENLKIVASLLIN